MSLSNKLLSLHEKSRDTSVYGEYTLPIDLKQMKAAYKRLNKELFGNKLPDCRLKWAALAKNFYGKYHHVYNTDNSAKDRLITMATITKNDPVQFEDTLIHEMIHVWQYWMEEKENDSKYLDHSWFELENDIHKRGHGKYFHELAKKFNKLGYKIEASSDAQIEKEMTSPVWVLLFIGPGKKSVFVYSVTDPMKHIDEIILNLEEQAGTGFFTSYIVVKTTDTMANQGLRLTKGFKIPKNSKRIYVDETTVIKAIVKSKLSKLIKSSDIIDHGDSNTGIDPEGVQLLVKMHKFRSTGFQEYLKTYLGNHTDYAKLIETDAYPEARNWGSYLSITNWEEGKPIKGIPDSVIKAVKDDWMNVSDVEMKGAFKFISANIRFAFVMKKDDNTKIQKDIKSAYEDFEGRVSKDRFKQVLVKTTLALFKRKDKGRYDEQVLKDFIDSFLVGSILESKIKLTNEIKNLINKGQ